MGWSQLSSCNRRFNFTERGHQISEDIIILQRILRRKIPFLNHGGCGEFALKFSDILDKHNIEYDLIVCSNTSDVHNHLHDLMQSIIDEEFRITFNHIVVSINDKHYDGHSQVDDDYFMYYGTIRKDELHMIRDIKGWNRQYDRELMNPILDSVLEEWRKRLD